VVSVHELSTNLFVLEREGQQEKRRGRHQQSPYMQEKWRENLLVSSHIPQNHPILHSECKSCDHQDQAHGFKRFRIVGGSRRVKGWTDNGEPGEDAEGDQLARPVKVGVEVNRTSNKDVCIQVQNIRVKNPTYEARARGGQHFKSPCQMHHGISTASISWLAVKVAKLATKNRS
jgi:hypothetical protein